MLLLDAQHPGQFGGTGKSLDWPALAELLAAERQRSPQIFPPIVLAGGLTPENSVGRLPALRRQPSTLLAASRACRRKDAALFRHFVAEAVAAFDRLRPK